MLPAVAAAAACLAFAPQPQPSPPARVESVEPFCRFVKRGAWVPLAVTVHTSGPYEGEIVARTDAAALFVARLRIPADGVHLVWLPVYWIGVRGQVSVHLHGSVSELVLRDIVPVQPQDLIVTATDASGLDPREETRGPQTMYIVRADRLPEGVLLESIDAIVGRQDLADDPACASFRMRGGAALTAEPRMETLATQGFAPAGEPREGSSQEPSLASGIRSGRAVLLLLLFGVVACAALLWLGFRQAPPRLFLPLIVASPLLFALLAVLSIPSDVVVIRATRVDSTEGGRMILFDAVSSSDRAISFDLEGLAKPLFDAPCRIEYDPSRRKTRVETLSLRAHVPVSFVSFQDYADAVRLSVEETEGGGIRVYNGESSAAAGVLLIDGRVRGRVEVGPGGSATVADATGRAVLDGIERLILRAACRSGRALLLRLEEPPAPPWREAGDIFVERQGGARYCVVR